MTVLGTGAGEAAARAGAVSANIRGVTRDALQRWLDAYVAAWRSYDPDQIGALFAANARYAYHPYDQPLVGRQAIVESWLTDRDPPDSWQASYRPLLIDANHAIATGETRYARGDVYANLWELTFEGDRRCTSFVEWYMKHPAPS